MHIIIMFTYVYSISSVIHRKLQTVAYRVAQYNNTLIHGDYNMHAGYGYRVTVIGYTVQITYNLNGSRMSHACNTRVTHV